jgi:putative methionine-R-sulfoxide reductase with GAF domain
MFSILLLIMPVAESICGAAVTRDETTVIVDDYGRYGIDESQACKGTH